MHFEKLAKVFDLCVKELDRVIYTLKGLVEIFLEEALGKPGREFDRVVPGGVKSCLKS